MGTHAKEEARYGHMVAALPCDRTLPLRLPCDRTLPLRLPCDRTLPPPCGAATM